MSSVRIEKSGPFFDGQFPKVIDRFEDAVIEDVADVAAQMIREELGHVLKHPTGRYRRSIQVVTKDSGDVVTDGGIIYGPWLEGVGSRNARSRFKGYATFRRISARVDGQVSAIGDRTLDRFIGRME